MLVASSGSLQHTSLCAATNTTIGAKPGSAWPGPDTATSHGAWAANKQPQSLEMWLPKTADGKPVDCWKTTPLNDIATGWPGKCNGMTKKEVFKNEGDCRAKCTMDPFCSAWLWTNDGCYQGHGTNCFSGSTIASSGQRLQHGDVVVLKDMSTYNVQNMRNLGIFSSVTAPIGAARCKAYCYSDIRCQYWQYGDAGCSVEDPDYGAVQYPLTTNGGVVGTSTLFAGEFIQHFCPQAQPPEDVAGTNYFLAIGAGVFALFGALFAIWACTRPKQLWGQKGRAVSWRKAGGQNGDVSDDGEASQFIQNGNPYEAATAWQQPAMSSSYAAAPSMYTTAPYVQPYQPAQGYPMVSQPNGFQSYSPYQVGTHAHYAAGGGGAQLSPAISME